ncbi:hypothetical protein V6N13_108499 [Hibiscus sabdariffa]
MVQLLRQKAWPCELVGHPPGPSCTGNPYMPSPPFSVYTCLLGGLELLPDGREQRLGTGRPCKPYLFCKPLTVLEQ